MQAHQDGIATTETSQCKCSVEETAGCIPRKLPQQESGKHRTTLANHDDPGSLVLPSVTDIGRYPLDRADNRAGWHDQKKRVELVEAETLDYDGNER